MGKLSVGVSLPDLDELLSGTFYNDYGILTGPMTPADAGGGTTVPSTVYRGCFPTYSMPTDHAGTAEYVTFGFEIPLNWDMTSDFVLELWFAQASGETSGEKYAWQAQYGFMNYGDVSAGTFVVASGTTTLGADGTVQYYEHWCPITIAHETANGTAAPGGFVSFKVHRRILGTTGEALLMGAKLGYWGTQYVGGRAGTITGTVPGKKLAANRFA